MQRILNDPDNIVDEMLSGFLKANSDIVEATENKRVVKARCKGEGKVGVITGGGSGHKPAFIGYVGENMCDAAAVGEICSSPTAVAFLDAAKCADQGKGVACLYGNYSGDNMNVKMAVKMAQKQGLTIKTVIANDDVASAPKNQREKRRGVAGEIFMWKCGGAKAAMGGSLDEVINAAQKAIDDEECEMGMRCVAVPIRNYTGEIIAGLSVSGPTTRMTLENIQEKVPYLLEISKKISRRLGAEI